MKSCSEDKGVVAFATFALAIGLSFIAVSVPAASSCKGLEWTKCKKYEHCNWIEPYTRKDGVNIVGHCKSKPGKADKSDAKKKSVKSDAKKKPASKGKSGTKKSQSKQHKKKKNEKNSKKKSQKTLYPYGPPGIAVLV